MAEAAVGLLIRTLTPLLDHEANLLGGINRDVARIRDELESIQAFLRDADARAENNGQINNGVRTWVRQVREVAFRIEDAIDEHTLHIARHSHRRGFFNLLHRVVRMIKELKPRHDLASEIQDIKVTIREIKERREVYGISRSEQEGSSSCGEQDRCHNPRVASLFVEEAELVGIEPIRDKLIGWLVEGESKRIVISLVGMGGLGKTTLAKKVYDNKIVVGYFDCCAWISVSQSYKEEEILRTMIKEFYRVNNELLPEGFGTMDKMLLIGKLREYLQQKRYVIVFDDVWKIEFWGFIKNALPNNDKGSRIIITTRIDDVAASTKESSFGYIHNLQRLPDDKAWELFCKKAFQFDLGGNCPPELKELSLSIVKRCEGLPLAIVAIGGLLSTKDKTLFQWKKLHDSLRSELQNDPRLTNITKILSLSYNDLPDSLKSCFLYFGVFPEDYLIACATLRWLWMAEGFIEGKKGKTLEQSAAEYLSELIQRSLVQVSNADIEGKPVFCRVHDLMREIILSKVEELGFCQVLGEDDASLNEHARRLSIHNIRDDVLGSIGKSPIRSVLLFGRDELPKPFMGTCFANFKLLKVINFEGASIDYLPGDVGNLFHLRYLSLRGTKIKMLPKSIGKLQNLQTLDLFDSLVYELPIEINSLRKLRHLVAVISIWGSALNIRGVKVKEGIGCLKDLHVLFYLEANQGAVLIEELGKLKQLRNLGLTKLRGEDCKALCASIEKMNHLEYLEVWLGSRDEILNLQYISSPPLSLKYLDLRGPLEKLPDWILMLSNLVELRLYWSRFQHGEPDMLEVLQALPNLLLLWLHEGYDGDQLYFKEGGFQRLKVLRLENLKELKMVKIEEGAMPLLEELNIGPSPHLKEVPFGIQHLRNLTTLTFFDMSKEFTLQIRPNEGQDYWKVRHIPNLRVGRNIKGVRYKTRTLQ